jgi:phenylalanyl-tRNA synthetase alpha chain
MITRTLDELAEILGRMGFDIASGPEVEDEFHNFEALNIPPAHPARDPLDNFYVDPHHLLRSQTSTVQIRVMESTPPPVRVIAPGRVYRPDTVDATHSFMFHQIEGLYVDEQVSMVDLKSCLNQFVHAFYGPEVDTRFRPSFFPFTEPSAELDILWSPDPDREPDWMELGGCGMVDPAVFTAVGYDPDAVSGFAFGMGIERILMAKYRIPDIRLLYEGDVRFLSQF